MHADGFTHFTFPFTQDTHTRTSSLSLSLCVCVYTHTSSIASSLLTVARAPAVDVRVTTR